MVIWLVLAIQTAEPAPAVPTLVPESAIAATNCIGPISRERVDFSVEADCTLDAHGAPQNCRLATEPVLTPKEGSVALCMAASYRYSAPDGASLEGRPITIPLRLSMNVVAPPLSPGFSPPPVRRP